MEESSSIQISFSFPSPFRSEKNRFDEDSWGAGKIKIIKSRIYTEIREARKMYIIVFQSGEVNGKRWKETVKAGRRCWRELIRKPSILIGDKSRVSPLASYYETRFVIPCWIMRGCLRARNCRRFCN